jgi:hypothetical protein
VARRVGEGRNLNDTDRDGICQAAAEFAQRGYDLDEHARRAASWQDNLVARGQPTSAYGDDGRPRDVMCNAADLATHRIRTMRRLDEGEAPHPDAEGAREWAPRGLVGGEGGMRFRRRQPQARLRDRGRRMVADVRRYAAVFGHSAPGGLVGPNGVLVRHVRLGRQRAGVRRYAAVFGVELSDRRARGVLEIKGWLVYGAMGWIDRLIGAVPPMQNEAIWEVVSGQEAPG